MAANINYRPEIDDLRALAVLGFIIPPVCLILATALGNIVTWLQGSFAAQLASVSIAPTSAAGVPFFTVVRSHKNTEPKLMGGS